MLSRKQAYRKAVHQRRCHPSDIERELGIPTPALGIRFLGAFKGKDSLDRLGSEAARTPRGRAREDSGAGRSAETDCIPGKSGRSDRGFVRFSCRIAVVLVPTRREFASCRDDMWWGDREYAQMRRDFIAHSRAEAAKEMGCSGEDECEISLLKPQPAAKAPACGGMGEGLLDLAAWSAATTCAQAAAAGVSLLGGGGLPCRVVL